MERDKHTLQPWLGRAAVTAKRKERGWASPKVNPELESGKMPVEGRSWNGARGANSGDRRQELAEGEEQMQSGPKAVPPGRPLKRPFRAGPEYDGSERLCRPGP